MSASHLIAWGRIVDGRGSLAAVEARWSELRNRDMRLVELTIDPLHVGWDAPVQPNHFRSGCAPVEAIAHADQLVRNGQAEAVLITGRDDLRTRYSNDKVLRQQLMLIYDDCPLPQAYTLLARAFMKLHDISEPQFNCLAEALYENYQRTAQRLGYVRPPRPEAFELVTDLFRGVDCANPVVDFAGAVIVAGDAAAPDDAHPVTILGTGLAQMQDGPAHVEAIARYEHLAVAWQAACAQAGVDIAQAFLDQRALLEVYTCFPVAPLGFLLAAGLASDVESIERLLATHEITVTGGMNLARAAWNNPALNATIALCEQLADIARHPASREPRLAAVHGNGGLGYRQGVAIFALNQGD